MTCALLWSPLIRAGQSYPSLIGITAGGVPQAKQITDLAWTSVLVHTGITSIKTCVETAFESHAQITTCDVTLNADGTVTIDCDVDFTVNFAPTGDSTIDFDGGILGFAQSSYSSTSTVLTSPYCSKVVWMPGENYVDNADILPYLQVDAASFWADDWQYNEHRIHNPRRALDLRFPLVSPERVLEQYADDASYAASYGFTQGDPYIHMGNLLDALWDNHMVVYISDHTDFDSLLLAFYRLDRSKWLQSEYLSEVTSKGPIYEVTLPLICSVDYLAS